MSTLLLLMLFVSNLELPKANFVNIQKIINL